MHVFIIILYVARCWTVLEEQICSLSTEHSMLAWLITQRNMSYTHGHAPPTPQPPRQFRYLLGECMHENTAPVLAHCLQVCLSLWTGHNSQTVCELAVPTPHGPTPQLGQDRAMHGCSVDPSSTAVAVVSLLLACMPEPEPHRLAPVMVT